MRVLLITGATGTGKTELSRALGDALPGWLRWSIDEQRAAGGDWPEMLDMVARLERDAILESVLISRRYKVALARHRIVCVTVVCREDIRQSRLMARDGNVPRPRNYAGWPEVPNYQLDSTTGISARQIEHLLSWIVAPDVPRPRERPVDARPRSVSVW